MYSQSRISIYLLVHQVKVINGNGGNNFKNWWFWDYEKDQNNENIIFQDNEDVDSWIKAIEDLYENQDKVSYISTNGLNLLKKQTIWIIFINLKKYYFDREFFSFLLYRNKI